MVITYVQESSGSNQWIPKYFPILILFNSEMVFYNYQYIFLQYMSLGWHILLSPLHLYSCPLPHRAMWAIVTFILVVTPEILSVFIHFHLDTLIPGMCLDQAVNTEFLFTISDFFSFFPFPFWNSAGRLTSFKFLTKGIHTIIQRDWLLLLKCCAHCRWNWIIHKAFVSFQMIRLTSLAKYFLKVILSQWHFGH